MKDTFTIRGVFKEARAVIKPQLWKVLGQYAWLLAFFILLSMLGGGNLLLGTIISALFAFTTAIVSLGYAKHGTFSFGEFAKAASFQSFSYFFLAFLVSKVFIVAGAFLLIVPGVMLAVWLSLVRFVAAEREIGPWDACKESARLTRGHRWKLLWFFVVAGLVNILGFACLIVGLFYTVPLSLIAAAIVYGKLRAEKETTPEVVAEAPAETAEPEGKVVDAEVV